MTKREPESRGKAEAELLDDLRSLSITAAHELLSGLDRLKQLREDWEGSDQTGRSEESRRRRARAKSLAYELARHEIMHAEKILSLSHAHADLLFEHARSIVQRLRAGGVESPSVVDLRAYRSDPDEPAVASFTIKNPFDTEADPRFQAAPFTTQSGETVEGLEASFSCIPACVRPHGTAEVSITADISRSSGTGVFFTEVTVSLVGDVERPVARRLVRLRIAPTRTNERLDRGQR